MCARIGAYTTHMIKVEPHIVARFPGQRDRILQKYFQDEAVAELCRDYDCLIETLEAAKSRQGTASQASDRQQELLELANELEKELLERLGLRC
jgi:transposase-like protein